VSVTPRRTKMDNLSSHSRMLVFLLLTLVQIQTKVFGYQYKVGDLDAWAIPTSTNPQVYKKWSQYHNLTIGDSLCKFKLFAIPYVFQFGLYYSTPITLPFYYKSDTICYHCICLCSVSIPTKPRFSDSSYWRILQEVQH